MKIGWSTGAVSALLELREYVAHDSAERADELCARLIAGAGQLTKFPYSGPLFPEDRAYRQLVVEGYRIVYMITEEEIRVTAVLPPGRLYSK